MMNGEFFYVGTYLYWTKTVQFLASPNNNKKKFIKITYFSTVENPLKIYGIP